MQATFDIKKEDTLYGIDSENSLHSLEIVEINK
jgi:hypothetical protein